MSEEPSEKALVEFGRAPQNALNSDKPGSYELAIRANKAEVAPGDTVDLEVFITGYGTIASAKLVFYPPPYFINSTWSTATYGLGLHSNNQFYWDKDEQALQEAGMTLSLAAGVKVDEWPETSLFFDMMDEPHKRYRISQIATETKLPRAPVEFRLHIQEKTPSGASIPSGTHGLDFSFNLF